MSDFETIEQAAARWVVLEDRGLGPAEEREFLAWLNESAGHRLAYLRLNEAWHSADRLAALKSPKPWVVRPRARSGFPLPVRLAAFAVIVLAIFSLTFLLHRESSTDRLTTGVGQNRIVKLSDGTRVELNTNTRIQTKMTPSNRTVTLDRGEVYLDVVHDAKRPFVVLAGNRRITDLGTKFSVLRDGDHVEVVVQEGRVRVDLLNASATGLPVFVQSGNIVTTKADETLIATKTSQEIANELDWRHGMLVFNQESLADAASEFNRYNSKHLVIKGAAREIRIGGSFKADNVDVFTQLIQDGFGLRVEKDGNDIMIEK